MKSTLIRPAVVILSRLQSDQVAKLFVWGVWLLMVLADLYILVVAGRTLPLNEDWWLVKPMTGHEPNLAQWFWTQNSEHRIPFPRLILLTLLKVSHGDYRSGMLFNIIVLAALALATIYVARYIRGRTSLADAFFPIALLHLGNAENLFWCWQLTQVVPTVMTCISLLALVASQNPATWGVALVGGISLMLLPLSGSHALLLAPSLALWLGYCGFLQWRAVTANGGQRWVGGFLMGSALAAVLFTGLHFATYERPSWRPPDPTLVAALETAVKFLTLGFGPAVRSAWLLPVVVLITLLTTSALVLILAFLRRPGQERYRAFGVFIFFGNLVLLALATGWGRATAIESVYGQYPLRYVIMAVPALLLVFFIWELYGAPRLRRVVQNGLFLAMCLLIPFNSFDGLGWLYWFPERDQAIEQDIQAGVPASILAERYRPVLLHWVEPPEIAGYMRLLRDAGIGPFAQMVKDSEADTQMLASAPTEIQVQSAPASGAQVVSQEIRYQLSKAGEVYLVWGINGWQIAPEALWPAGTELRDRVMYTPMRQEGNTFVAKIQVPIGTKLDYGFMIGKKGGFPDLFRSASPVWVWDWNREQGYQMVISEAGISELEATYTVAEYLFSIDFGYYLMFAVPLILGLALGIASLDKRPGYWKEAIRVQG